MQWKGIVENQELYLATSLTRTLGERFPGIVEEALQIFMGSWMLLLFCFFMHMNEHRARSLAES